MNLCSVFNPNPTFTTVTVTTLTVSGLTPAGFVKTATGAGGLLSTEAFGANTYVPYSSGTGFTYSANLTFNGTTLTSISTGLNSILASPTYATKQTTNTYPVYSVCIENWTSIGGITRSAIGASFTSNAVYNPTFQSIGSDAIYGIFGSVVRSATSSSTKANGFITRGLSFTSQNDIVFSAGSTSSSLATGTRTLTDGAYTKAFTRQEYNNASHYWESVATAFSAEVSVAPVLTATLGVKTYGIGLNLNVATTDKGALHTSINYGIYNTSISGADANYFLYDANQVQSIHTGNLRVGNSAVEPTVALDVTGGNKRTVSTTKTTTYQILITDYTIVCEHATVAFTVTLPAASATTIGQIFHIKNIGAAIVSVDQTGTDTLDGYTTTADLSQWDCICIQGQSATGWIII
jgi:hypothetical protein